MKLKEFTVAAEMKVSKNYNSVGSVISLTVSLEDGDDFDTSYEEVSDTVHGLIDNEMTKGLEVLKSQVKK